MADVKLRLPPLDRELTTYPALYQEMSNCYFVVAKITKMRFYCQFFYKRSQQFSTGRCEFDDLFEYVTTLLQAQADHKLSNQAD